MRYSVLSSHCSQIKLVAFLLGVLLTLVPSLHAQGTKQASQVKPECCIAVYATDDVDLLALAHEWLDSQDQCTIKQLWTKEEVATDTEIGGAIAANKEDCSKVYFGHFEHGPVCKSVIELAKVCTDTYNKCDVDIVSSSCSSFSSTQDAEKYIKAAQLAAHVMGRKITITGEQTNQKMGQPECSVTKTYTLKEDGISCSFDDCAAEGTLCSPPGASVSCMHEGVKAFQRCCKVLSYEDSNLNMGRFLTPNSECPAEGTGCSDPNYFESILSTSAGGAALTYGTEPCPGAFRGLTKALPIAIVKSCTGAKCQYRCKSPYVYDASTKSCKQPYRCLGFPNQAHTVPCNNFGSRLTADQGIQLVDPERCPQALGHCALKCATGYHKENFTCVPDYKCLGSVPANATLCKDSRGVPDDKEVMPFNLLRIATFDCSTSRKCEYQCKPGYRPQFIPNEDYGLTCFKPKCTGSKPKNAVFCEGSDLGITRDTPITFYGNTSCMGYACEYRCREGYTPDLAEYMCNKIKNYTPPPPRPPKDPKAHSK